MSARLLAGLALTLTLGATAPGRAAVATRTELQTVGPDFAVVAVTTNAATDGVVVTFGRDEGADATAGETPAPLDSVAGRHHVARMGGLAPGTAYRYRVEVDGAEVAPDAFHPGAFATLPLPGRFLFSFAVVTDTHVGEETAGLVAGSDFTGFSWPDPANPHWRFTNEAAVRAIAGAGVAFAVHNGDVTADAARADLETARDLFGALPVPVYYNRGNHDRPGDGPDAFREVFGLDATSRRIDVGRHILLLLDTSDPQTGVQVLDEERLAWFEQAIAAAAAERRPIWVFAHHPVSENAEVIFALFGAQRQRVLSAIAAAAPWVVAVFGGHSHRNARRDSAVAPGVPFVETAATKEYPGSWTEVRVFSDGWLKISHPIDGAECRVWFDTTSAMYDGRAPSIKLGSLAERSFAADFPEALRAPAPDAGPDAGSNPTAPDGGRDPRPADADATPEATADAAPATDARASAATPTAGGCGALPGAAPGAPGAAVGGLLLGLLGLLGARRRLAFGPRRAILRPDSALENNRRTSCGS